MRAWFAGDFDGCLALCDRVRPSDVDMVSQLALLRARALLRLGRADEAIGVVRSVFIAHGTLDASLTARMLLGEALVRRGRPGDVDEGIAVLRAAQDDGGAAHATVRSEIALGCALGYYVRRDLAGAELALSIVAPSADIVYARALQLSGWIAVARVDYSAAIARFRSALLHLDQCRQADRRLEIDTVYALAVLAPELIDRESADFVDRRLRQFVWPAAGCEDKKCLLAIFGSVWLQMQGREVEAFALARHGEEVAPTTALRIFARCRRIELSREVGETFTPYDLTQGARDLFAQLDPAQLQGEERLAALALAEELAHVLEPEAARELLATYRAEGIPATMAFAGDPRNAAQERYVSALIADASGDRLAARAGYTEAFHTFRSIGYRRRAMVCALALVNLTGEDDLYRYVAAESGALAPSFWIRREYNARLRLHEDQTARNLTSTEREVLRLILRGKSNQEIATERQRSYQRIKNTVHRVFRSFNVKTRPELIAECQRRGIVNAE